MTSLRARPLTPGEERYIRKSERDAINFSGPLSIIGASDHLYVQSTIHSDLTKLERIHLGEGQYIEETTGYGPAEGGVTISIEWDAEYALRYLLFVAKELGIPYLERPGQTGLVYFQSKRETAFAESVLYVDRTLASYEKRRSFLDRWFGPICMTEWSSGEAKAIREEVRQILIRSINR
jgi:hypothetical protein